jgi:hypothetical protein
MKTQIELYHEYLWAQDKQHVIVQNNGCTTQVEIAKQRIFEIYKTDYMVCPKNLSLGKLKKLLNPQ